MLERVNTMIVRVNTATVLTTTMTVRVNSVAERVISMSVRVNTVTVLVNTMAVRVNMVTGMVISAGLQTLPAAKITRTTIVLTFSAPFFGLPKTRQTRIFKSPNFSKCLSIKMLRSNIKHEIALCDYSNCLGV
jgi:hypothetical protein